MMPPRSSEQAAINRDVSSAAQFRGGDGSLSLPNLDFNPFAENRNWSITKVYQLLNKVKPFILF